jgi:hypothetical protein
MWVKVSYDCCVPLRYKVNPIHMTIVALVGWVHSFSSMLNFGGPEATVALQATQPYREASAQLYREE